MTKPKRTPRPPKRAAIVPLGRLQPHDKERIKADVAAFIAYVRRKRAEAMLMVAILAIIYLPIATRPLDFSSVPAQPTPTATTVRAPG